MSGQEEGTQGCHPGLRSLWGYSCGQELGAALRAELGLRGKGRHIFGSISR